jgi:hypothetical protein
VTRCSFALIIACVSSGAVAAQAADPRCAKSVDRVQPKNGVISNASIAKVAALAYLDPIYGEETIRRELPLKASLTDEVWTVSGTLPERSAGGTAEIRLCQRNGLVLSIIHYK